VGPINELKRPRGPLEASAVKIAEQTKMMLVVNGRAQLPCNRFTSYVELRAAHWIEWYEKLKTAILVKFGCGKFIGVNIKLFLKLQEAVVHAIALVSLDMDKFGG
jgi:hypothetical protein